VMGVLFGCGVCFGGSRWEGGGVGVGGKGLTVFVCLSVFFVFGPWFFGAWGGVVASGGAVCFSFVCFCGVLFVVGSLFTDGVF